MKIKLITLVAVLLPFHVTVDGVDKRNMRRFTKLLFSFALITKDSLCIIRAANKYSYALHTKRASVSTALKLSRALTRPGI